MNAGKYEDVIRDPSCVIYGLLNQKRKSGEKNQRYCAVWKNYFLNYKDKIDIKPQVAFTLEGFKVEKCDLISDNEQGRYTFELSKPGVVTHLFEADSEDNLKEWLSKIQEIITETIHDQSPKNAESNTLQEDLVSVATASDEPDSNSASFNFAAVDEVKLRNLNINATRIHTCLSFDSVTKVTKDENSAIVNTMQRSEEIEDLSSIVDDYDCSDEELIIIEKNKFKNQQQSQPESSTDVFGEKKYDTKIKENEVAEGKPDNTTIQGYEEQTEDKVEMRKQRTDDEFFSGYKDRTKSLSEEVFEALGMTEEIEIIKEEEEVKSVSTVEDLKQKTDVNDIKKIDGSKKEVSSSIKRSTELKFDEKIDEKIDEQVTKDADETKQNVTINVSVQRLREAFQKASKRKQQMQCRKENREIHSRPETLPFPKIEGFVNVISESTSEWTKMWAALKIDHIDFRQSSNSDKSEQIIPIEGLQLQPSVWDTNRLLAFKVIRNNKVEVIMEPNDIQDFGRWVSGLFHCIQQRDVKKFATSEANSSDCEAEMKSADGADAVSVKDMRAIFENARKDNCSSPPSNHSSPSPSLTSPVFNIRSQMTSTPLHQSPSRQVTPQDFDSNYADVVSWLGRYIEQEGEKQVLSSMANPFLAKLRLRHKLEMIAQIEAADTSLEDNIKRLKEKLMQKLAAKKEASNKKNSTGLIRSAEDAKRAGNESKRMEKECADIQSQIRQSENQLEEMRNAAYELQHEIEMAYEQFDWGQENDNKNNPTSEQDSVVKRDKVDKKLVIPGWTKNTKEKAQASQNIGNNDK